VPDYLSSPHPKKTNAIVNRMAIANRSGVFRNLLFNGDGFRRYFPS
jgi:hypothetical protein